MPQPPLTTSRLRLVPLAEEHLDHEAALDADPEVMRYVGDGRARTRADVASIHRKRLSRADVLPGSGYWAGFFGVDFIGWWNLEPPERPDQGPTVGQAELGYRIMRTHWRQGFASEGAGEILRYAFDDLGLTRIFAETMAVNQGSRATMAAIGMTYVRTFHLTWDEPINGVEWGEVEYAITRQQWDDRH